MTEKEFLMGWALLESMPYALHLRNPDREKLQRGIYAKRYGKEERSTWMKTVEWWIAHEDHWPLPAALDQRIREFRPPTKPAPDRKQLSDGPHITCSMDDIIDFAKRHDITRWQAVRQWEEVEQENQSRKNDEPEGGVPRQDLLRANRAD
jgi:hypothetical protein